VNSIIDVQGVRFAPVQQQPVISIDNTSAFGGNSAPGLVVLQQNAAAANASVNRFAQQQQQRPLLAANSLFMPPRVLMP